MLISKTPLRISLFSGGSDLKSFYTQQQGAALSCTIDKFIYCFVHNQPTKQIKTVYDNVDYADCVDDVTHEITKQTLKYFNQTNNITCGSISDITARGSGLGSSSAFTVGLVNCLAQKKFGAGNVLQQYVAATACEIEIDRCQYPIGKQDQYAAAYGGFNLFQFNDDETVDRTPVYLAPETYRSLQENLILCNSGIHRQANDILKKQSTAMSDHAKFDLVRKSRDKAYEGVRLLQNKKVDDFGYLFDCAWQDKKAVVSDITNTFFDQIYDEAKQKGCIGGKLLGAGGGGFFLFYCKNKDRERVIKQITKHKGVSVLNFNFTDNCSTVVYSD